MSSDDIRQEARERAIKIVKRWAGEDKLNGKLSLREIRELCNLIANALIDERWRVVGKGKQ